MGEKVGREIANFLGSERAQGSFQQTVKLRYEPFIDAIAAGDVYATGGENVES